MFKSFIMDYKDRKLNFEQKAKEFNIFKAEVESKMHRINKNHQNKMKNINSKISNYSK